ncbi:hypothetical protein ALC53_04402 [Atta colombica]|uniref:Double jelly roll-like domain-containing protein n=1 Tax=Atta colombica TaxID=520822 RepID=A0A195BLX8_9HYME|nr:hypothetical protein ALC53_04402 [Atta colombica]
MKKSAAEVHRMLSNTYGEAVISERTVAFIFDEIRYELNGVEIDCNRNVSTQKLCNSVIRQKRDSAKCRLDAQTTATGYFNVCVPLYVLLGFCENYKRVVINARHELILIRARNDNNYLMRDPATEPTLELFKVQWRMPHVLWSERNKQVMSEDVSRFDDCKLTNAKLYMYDLYARFCKGYYAYEYLEPNLTFTTFLRNGPFVIIDCFRQNESVKIIKRSILSLTHRIFDPLGFACPVAIGVSLYEIGFKKFVADPTHWRHMPGAADLPSRGCSVVNYYYQAGERAHNGYIPSQMNDLFRISRLIMMKLIRRKKSYVTSIVTST